MIWNPRIAFWLIEVLAVVGFIIATWSVWRSESVKSAWLRLLVWLLRLGSLALLLLILANPVRQDLAKALGGTGRNVILVDTSDSMSLEKPQSRFTQALAWSQEVAATPPAGQTCQIFGFADDVHFDGEPALGGASTRLSRALRRVLESDAGQQLTNIIVVSDGRIHDREDLAGVLAIARQRRVSISTHAIGRDEQPVNAFIRVCRAERSASSGSRIPVDVEIGGTGLANGTELELSLKDESGAVLASAPVALNNGSASRQFMLTTGLRTASYTVSITHLKNEITYADNDFTFTVEVADPKIRVFYTEGSQTIHDVGDERWAAGRLITTALRRSGDIQCDLFMMEHQNTPGKPIYYVKGFDEDQHVILDLHRGMPTDREGWWNYDVVIISDIDKRTFSDELMEWVRQLVADRGGGYCMIGGNLSFDAGHYEQTIWDKLIPVACQRYGFGQIFEPTKPMFPKEVRNHPILRMASDPALNDAILDVHPALLGYHDIRRTKPGATTLARVGDSEAPFIAVQDYGKGHTMAFLSDAAGGWGDGGYQGYWGPKMLADALGAKAPEAASTLDPATTPANEFYNRFWVNTIRWLAENSLRRKHQALVGRTDAIIYRPGEVVKVAATTLNVFDEAALENQSVGARLMIDGQDRVRLSYDRDRKEFVGRLTLPETLPGSEVRVLFDSVGSGPPASDEVRLRVMQLAREYQDTTPDTQLMADVASGGGGAVLDRPGEARSFMERHRIEAQTEATPYSEPLWSRGGIWSALVALLCSEWIVRRLAKL